MNPTTKNLSLLLFVISISLPVLLSQPQQPPPPPPPNTTCNDVFLSYTYTNGFPIPPTDQTNQGYRFESTVTVLNNGRDELKSWRVFVGFRNDEILVSATNAVLGDGTSLPALVGNGTVLAGFPETDLKTAIETAGDLTQMEARIQLVGTQFGEPNVSLPANLTLLNDGYSCPNPTTQGREMHLCCRKSLTSSEPDITPGDSFLPRQDGDLIIMYDVINSQSTFYWAQVSISNHNPLSRLDSWKLSWEWKRDEFIFAMKGAYPSVVDTTDCLFGRQGQYYQHMDFSQALNCKKTPTIVDLPLTMANDTNLGKIPFCCRNGTILPPNMDPSQSISAFQMQVFKMEPDLNKTVLFPPQNWKINGTLSSDFQCGSPVPVSPSLFPDPSGLPSERSAIASWQIVCNITHSKQETPKCCVSFSSFLNDSVIPCSTCACGCTKNPTQTCSTSEPALLLPSEALLLPFDNRTRKALAFADLKRTTVPNPLPCGDNCGVSINWHLLTDNKDGWTARITVFNWGRTNFVDWFTAVEMDKAGPGFEEVYSFNGTALPGSNSTIFMHGLVDRNFLLAEQDSSRPKKDPPIPGTQQSVILFSKKKTPGINVAGRDGFPTRVIFNGEECALPSMLPSSSSRTIGGAISIFGLLIALLPLLMQ